MIFKNFESRSNKFMEKHKIEEVINTCNFNNEVKVYLASGCLFTELGQIGLELIADICEEIGLKYYLPQHADFNDKGTTEIIITNKMIADGDNEQLKTCNFVLAHIQSPEDSGVCGEISRFKTMQEYEPNKYLGVTGWTDDIRCATIPSPNQCSFDNQTIYFNQYVIGEVQNSLGCHDKLGDCFLKMYEIYLKYKKDLEV